MSFPEARQILANLKGQHVRMPDLHPVIGNLHPPINKHRDSVVPVINSMLEKYSVHSSLLFSNTRSLSLTVHRFSYSEDMAGKLRRIDLASLVSYWFPFAEEKELRALTLFVGWMYLVDDVIDLLSGPKEEDQVRFKKFTGDTTRYVEFVLGVNESVEVDLQTMFPGVDAFKELGKELMENYSLGKCLY